MYHYDHFLKFRPFFSVILDEVVKLCRIMAMWVGMSLILSVRCIVLEISVICNIDIFVGNFR